MSADTKHKATLWVLLFLAIYGFIGVYLPISAAPQAAASNTETNPLDVINKVISFHSEIFWLDALVLTPLFTYLAVAWASSVLPGG